MTRLERHLWLHPAGAESNMTWLYPWELAEPWMSDGLVAGGRPAGHEATITAWLAEAAGAPDALLTATCTGAFVIAAQAALRPGDEAVLFTCSYDPWVDLLGRFGVTVVLAGRDRQGYPDLAKAAALCTSRTRAMVVVSPDNPLGSVCPQQTLAALAALCANRDMTLIADHCLAPVAVDQPVPLLPAAAAAAGLASWAAVVDTGKVLGLRGTKFGAVCFPPSWRDRAEHAASAWFFAHDEMALARVAAVLADDRFGGYLDGVRGQIGANYSLLEESLAPPLVLDPPGGGPFALLDPSGLGVGGERYAELLAWQGAPVVPVVWSPGADWADPRVRVALARHPDTVAAFAKIANSSPARRPGRPGYGAARGVLPP